MPLVRRLASLCAAAALVTGFVAAPASADNAAHKLRKAKAQAARLDAQAKAQAARISVARAQLAQLDAQANAALAAVQAAAQASAMPGTTGAAVRPCLFWD